MQIAPRAVPHGPTQETSPDQKDVRVRMTSDHQPAPEHSTSIEEGSASPRQTCGMIALIGRANVGKSTLLNAILEEKVSIVTPVAQTTRNLVRGILTERRGQLVFLDTPGMHRADGQLGQSMNRVARASIEGVDVAALVLDGSTPPRLEDEGWMRRLAGSPTHVLFILNKSDCHKDCSDAYKQCWQSILEEKESTVQVRWMRTSAAHGSGVPGLLQILFNLVPEGPYLFPEDVLTDFPRKLAIGDLIREKLFLQLHQELPHQVAVWIESIDETESRWAIEATIYVNKPSQKGIVIGEKGRLLRRVKRAAEKEIAAIYEQDIRLRLHVKVEKNWIRNYWLLKKFGYVE